MENRKNTWKHKLWSNT